MRLILAVAVFAAFAAPASASFVVPSATYTGQVATGGTIKFKVSTDGNELTFIEVREAHTSCGIFSIPPGPAFPSIADDSFVGVFIVEPTGKMIVEGSFTAPRQAEG
ncbi:MAG TPA: hypothetical protein VNN15_03585, partial [Solirubrobacterales bacterium]|nr:hypothetical protein [Solirubrobacterales bacterium]